MADSFHWHPRRVLDTVIERTLCNVAIAGSSVQQIIAISK